METAFLIMDQNKRIPTMVCIGSIRLKSALILKNTDKVSNCLDFGKMGNKFKVQQTCCAITFDKKYRLM